MREKRMAGKGGKRLGNGRKRKGIRGPTSKGQEWEGEEKGK